MNERPHSKGEIDRLGERLRTMGHDGPEPADRRALNVYRDWLKVQLDDALRVFQTIVDDLSGRLRLRREATSRRDGLPREALVDTFHVHEPSKRPKRLASIVAKLERDRRMALSEMQDVVGARFTGVTPLDQEDIFVAAMRLLIDPPPGQKWKIYNRRTLTEPRLQGPPFGTRSSWSGRNSDPDRPATSVGGVEREV